MNKIYFILFFGVLLSTAKVNAQVTVTGADATTNAASPFTTLSATFTSINGHAQAGNNIVIRITANTTEPTAGASLNAGTWTSMSIQPSGGGARTLSRAVTAGSSLLNFNGADNVTVDGLNAGGNSLTFSNTTASATSGTSTIRFIGDALNNTVTNCIILGSSIGATTVATGTVLFSTGTTTGNDNNTISNNNIGPAGVNLPTKGVMGLGSSSTIINDGNLISNNNIYDFFLATTSVSGIYVYNYNDNWTISNNRIYQTATRTFTTTAGLRYAGITLNTATGTLGAFTVTGNTIGFGSSSGTGTTTITGTGNTTGLRNEFRGIDAQSVNTTTATSIQGNSISGINLTTSRNSTTTPNSCFTAIALGTTDGNFNCGNTTGNTIGSLDGSSTVVINTSSTTASTTPIIGILDYSIRSNNISNNGIGSITIQGTGSVVGFMGILILTNTGLTATTNNNIIGGSSAGTITNSLSGANSMYGIYNALANASLSGNLISNMSGNSNGASLIVSSGILVTGATGVSTISQNVIHSLSNNSGSASNSIYAIYSDLPSTANIIERNFIHSLFINSTNKTSRLVGIYTVTGGSGTYRNNMVRLGIDALGASITGGYFMTGIWETAGTNNFYYNSVYIGGTGVASVSNTYAFYSTISTNITRNYKNNIFYNSRSNASGGFYNLAIRIGGTTGLTSDYNDLYADGTDGVVGYSGGIQTTLANWQTATGKDANSVSSDPIYINPTGNAGLVDLHLSNSSSLDALATPIAGITTDYDNDARDATTPDIGADEFTAIVNQVTITATAGVTGPTLYSNLRNAFNKINDGTHQGAVTVSINTNTTETAQAVLNRTGTGGASYTSVNIRPVNDGLSVSGNQPSDAIIKFNNATNVTFDGDNPNTAGTNRNLSVINTGTVAPNVIWIGGSSGNTANNVVLKNCIAINGSVNSSAVIVSDAATLGNPGYFTNITIQNNSIQKAFIGIYNIAAATAGNGSGLLITGNSLNSSGTNSISSYGVYLEGIDGASVSGNDIGNFESATAEVDLGVLIAANTTNTIVENNIIHDIKYTGTSGYAGQGILIGTGLANANVTVRNNMIYGISGDGDSYTTYGADYSPAGIYVFGAGQGGINIYFNSIWLTGNTLRNTNVYSIGIALGGNCTANIKNNIIRNQLGRFSGTVNSVCIAAETSASQFISLDYNDLLCDPTGTGSKYTGKIGAANSVTLANWQTATGQEANSIIAAPVFTSTTDLHLTAGSNNSLKSGIAITGITTDIDGDLRNLGLPTMGADETYLANLWAGNTSTDWGTNTNWDNSVTPTSGLNIGIPFGVPNMPVLDADRTIGTLTFLRTGTGTVGLNGHKLTIGGAVTGTGTFTGSSTSSLTLNGTTGTLNFTQTTAATRSLKDLTLGTSGTATIGTALDVYGNVQVNNTATGAMNFNDQEVTLKSDVNNTATIDKLYGTTGANLTGATNVTAERWIPLRLTGGLGSGTGNNGRAYRVLTSTVSSGATTINASWQEGLSNNVIGVYKVPPSPYEHFGTHITGAGGSTNGFDITQTNESSLYTFTNGSNINGTIGYPAVGNTNATIDGMKGYFMYIRGDRNVSTQLPYQPAGSMPTSSTTLRAKGSVLKGNMVYTISATSGDFSLITNPYSAPLDWDLVSLGNPNITGFYTFWDPNPGIRGGFTTIPTGGSLGHRYIQAGEGFFVQKNGTGGGTVTITEAMKAVGNNENTVFGRTQTTFESFRAELYLTEATNNIRHTADEVLVRYDNSYSPSVDWSDAEDIDNWNENIAISRGGIRLAIESRPVITDKDTIPLFMNSMRKTNYEFEFTPSVFSNTGLVAELIDNYLNSRTLLSVTSTVTVPFTVNNDAGSFATNRFMVVFGNPSGPLPIDLSSVKAYEKNTGIQVDWVMNTEQDMDRYEVEKSADGRSFAKATTVASKGNSPIQVNYGWFDANPIFGDNFYRIKSFDKGGQYKYSNIVRVNMGKGGATDISIYPNPYEGNGFNLQMTKFAAGEYMMTMYNSLGQRVYSGKVIHGGGSATQYINLGKDLAAGTYTVKISGGTTELTRTITKK